MPDPLVVQAMRQFRNQLLQMDAAELWQMAEAWYAIERQLQTEIELLATQLLADFPEGITAARLFRYDRYQSLLAQLRLGVESYVRNIEPSIATMQAEFGRQGIANAVEAIRLSFTGVGQAVGSFNLLPFEAIVNMVGLAGNGSPLRALLAEVYPTAVEGLTKALIKGTALGWNPRKTAREMRNGAGMGLSRAQLIARTEQLRVYREASRMAYAESGVVVAQRRLAAHNTRVCAACIMSDGEIIPLTETLFDHPQGACTAVPVVRGVPMIAWEFGPEWFRGQPEDVQRQILGKGKYDLWKKTDFDLQKLVTHTEDPVWGRSLNPTSLKELLAA